MVYGCSATRWSSFSSPSSLVRCEGQGTRDKGQGMFTPAETIACRRLVVLAIAEDVGAGDLTSLAVIPEGLEGRAHFVSRADVVMAGHSASHPGLSTTDPR